VALLVFFLTGLSYGLAQQNRTAVNTWGIDGLLLAKDSDNSLNLSTFSEEELANVKATDKTYLAQLSAIASKADSDEKASVSIFAIDKESFLRPEITEGKLSLANFEKIRYDQSFPEGEAKINAIVYRGKVTSYDNDQLANVSVADFINDFTRI